MTIIELVDGKIKTEKLTAEDIIHIITTTTKAAAGQKFGTWAGRGE